MHSVQKNMVTVRQSTQSAKTICKGEVNMSRKKLLPHKNKTKGKVDRMWRRMDPAVLWQRKYDRGDGALEL